LDTSTDATDVSTGIPKRVTPVRLEGSNRPTTEIDATPGSSAVTSGNPTSKRPMTMLRTVAIRCAVERRCQ